MPPPDLETLAMRAVEMTILGREDPRLLVANKRTGQFEHGSVTKLGPNAKVEVEQGGRKRELRARLASPEERARLWPVCVEHYAPYEEYQRRTERAIPVFVCEPR